MARERERGSRRKKKEEEEEGSRRMARERERKYGERKREEEEGRRRRRNPFPLSPFCWSHLGGESGSPVPISIIAPREPDKPTR